MTAAGLVYEPFECNACYQKVDEDLEQVLVLPGGWEAYHLRCAPAAELRAAS